MKISTLSISCVAAALCVGALAPGEAWAKKRDTRPSCNQFESIQCAASPGTYRHSNYSGKPMSDADMRSFYEGLGMLCNVGGGVMTVASTAAALGIGGTLIASATAGPIGLGVGSLCILQQLIGLGMPPPKPLIVKGPTKNVVVNIDMNDPKVREFFNKHPEALRQLQQAPAQPVPPKGADVPVAQAPEVPQKKTAEAPAPKTASTQAPEVPQKKTADIPAQKQKPSVPAQVPESAPAAQKPPTPRVPKDPLAQQEAQAPVGYKVINSTTSP